MNDIHRRLAGQLLELNESLSFAQSLAWVELLWDDFETSRAKAGYSYKGKEMTEQIVVQWIKNYGPRLHEFIATNPKYKHMLNRDDYLKH